MTDAPAKVRRPRRQRSVSESLLSIALGMEAVMMFFVALTVYGLHSLPPAVAFGGGGAFFVVLALATQVLRFRWGVWVGWVLQVCLLATGLVTTALYIVAAVFVGIWIYCFVRGRQIDREKAEWAASAPATETTVTTESTETEGDN